jgi:hypothetical protein
VHLVGRSGHYWHRRVLSEQGKQHAREGVQYNMQCNMQEKVCSRFPPRCFLAVLIPSLRVLIPSLLVLIPSLRVLIPSLRVLIPSLRVLIPSLRVLIPSHLSPPLLSQVQFWQQYVELAEQLHKQYKRNVTYTEIGYCSGKCSRGNTPTDSDYTAHAAHYEAVFEAFRG